MPSIYTVTGVGSGFLVAAPAIASETFPSVELTIEAPTNLAQFEWFDTGSVFGGDELLGSLSTAFDQLREFVGASQANARNVSFLRTEWSGGTTDTIALTFRTELPSVFRYTFHFPLGGAPIDAFDTAEESFDFLTLSRIDRGLIPGNPFQPETQIDLTVVDWESITPLPKPAGVDATGDGADNLLTGTDGDERLDAGAGNDTIEALDGADTIIAGTGDDHVIAGRTTDDERDLVFAGDGNDSIDGGAGNDDLNGGNGNDTIEGGFGVDTVIGNAGDDVLTGSAFSDLIFGGDGADFINGGFGFDRVNGGSGADRFFHIGVEGHASDWIQDFTANQGDRLVYGGTATADQFQVNFTETANAGQAGVEEAFVIYRPTGQILWALVDGAEESSITVRANGMEFDLLL